MVNIVFFGTPSFAVPALEALLNSEHSVVVVVTQPDRQRGRGQRLSASPIKEVALNSRLPIFQPTKLNDVGFLDELAELRPDLGVVVAYGQHEAIPVTHDDTTETVEPRLAKLGASLLISCVNDFAQGNITQENQDESKATFAPRITKEDGQIQWTNSAEQIHNQIRGLHPWPHAYSYLNGTRHLILQSEVMNLFSPNHATTRPGQIITVLKDRVIVATGGADTLGILKIQLPGRAPLATRAFLAGHPIAAGSLFQSQSP